MRVYNDAIRLPHRPLGCRWQHRRETPRRHRRPDRSGGHFRCGMQAVAGGVHHVASGQPYHPRQPPEWGCITQGRQAFNAEDAYLEHTGALSRACVVLADRRRRYGLVVLSRSIKRLILRSALHHGRPLSLFKPVALFV
jgi:hypothetical protein